MSTAMDDGTLEDALARARVVVLFAPPRSRVARHVEHLWAESSVPFVRVARAREPAKLAYFEHDHARGAAKLAYFEHGQRSALQRKVAFTSATTPASGRNG